MSDSKERVIYSASTERTHIAAASRLYVWLGIAAILAAMACIQTTAALQESQTWDEADHLSAGYSYWKTGNFVLNKEHPPLAKLLMAVPLLFTTLNMPPLPADPTYANETAFSKAFLYSNRLPADTLLLRARLVAILITVAFGVVLALWTSSAFGPGAALLAVLLFGFDPNILAHGRYVTTDILVSLTMFIACIVWSRFLLEPSGRWLCLAGITVGLALLSKFSAIVLPFILVTLYLVRWWQQDSSLLSPTTARQRLSLSHLPKSLIVVGLISFFIIYAGYSFQTRTLSSQSSLLSRQPNSDPRGATSNKRAQAVFFITHQAPVPAGPWFLGLLSVLKESRSGRPLFLAGHSYSTGQWFYFPSVFVMKTPLGTLALLLLACALALWQIAQNGAGWLTWLRSRDFRWFLTTVPVLVFLAFSMQSHVNIGLRHILPIYPFLFAFIAGTLTSVPDNQRRPWLKAAIVATTAVLVGESLMIYPHHLAFLNYGFGGPGQDLRYLSNSDVDWGQDVKGLAAYLSSHHVDRPCIAYAGQADLRYYRIESRPAPTSQELLTSPVPDCVEAVSVSNLNARGKLYHWLDRYQPTAKIGYSIYVYDVRKH